MTEACSVPTEIIEDMLSLLAVLGRNGFFYGIGPNPNPGQDHPYLKVLVRYNECYFEKKAMGPNLWRQMGATQCIAKALFLS